MSKYPWYPLSATVHKVLIHGYQIMESSVLPLGFLGENASEPRNKYYKSDRRSHPRQNYRFNNMTDVLHRGIDTSDPLISSIVVNKRAAQKQSKPLPADVISLLKTPSFESQNINSTIDDSDTDSDSETEIMYCFELDAEEEEDI